MHIGGVMIFEPRRDGSVPSVAEVCDHLSSRMEHLPRYGKRLSSATTGGFSWPSWVEDERFDLASHVRRAAVPAPGRREELLEWASEYFSERLDRARPLWELVIVDGLEDGRWALVSKTHHAMVDGVGAIDVGGVILDAEPGDAPPTPPEDVSADREPPPPPAPPDGRSPLGGVAASAWGLARLPLRAGRAGVGLIGAGVGLALHPSRAVEGLKQSQAMVDLLVRDEVVAAPRTSLNVPTGGHRRLAVASIPLTDIKRAGKALGGTVNDVVLAAAAGGLREMLLARGEEPPSQGLRAMVPVNLRTAGEHLALGNKITTLFVHLPVAEPDPMRRFRLQIAEAESLKAGNQGIGSRTLIDFTAHAPPVIHSFLARSMYATRLFNLTITNVPGPQMTLYALGSRLREIWPLVPLATDHAVGLAVISYDGEVFFCINADRDATPDIDVLSDGIVHAFEELRVGAAEAEHAVG
jgi:WS/DGAT/MGAT family acyltransferase